MKHLKLFKEYYSDYNTDFEEVDGNVLEPYIPEPEIDGNRYEEPKEPKKHGEEETGTVQKFFPHRNFGFIIGDTDGEKFFTNTYHSIDKIKTGDRVKFIIKRTRSKKLDKATKVELI